MLVLHGVKHNIYCETYLQICFTDHNENGIVTIFVLLVDMLSSERWVSQLSLTFYSYGMFKKGLKLIPKEARYRALK